MRTEPEFAYAVQSVSAPRRNGSLITQGRTKLAIWRGLYMNLFVLPIVNFEVKMMGR